MRRDKQLAITLRKEGKTYREIEKEINISRSTLCEWFKNEDWSKKLKNNNINKNITLSTNRILILNQARQIKLANLYFKVSEEAEKEYQIFKKDPLFMAGLMLYAGEGDKRNQNNTRISNSEFYIHDIFIKFSEKYLNIEKKNIKFNLLVYPDLDIKECCNIWSRELGIDLGNFHKTQVLKGKESTKKLQYGVGISIISSVVVVKKKILRWLDLSKKEF
jgi:hypothetical protein